MTSIFTAGYLYVGKDRLDITRRGTSRQARRGKPAPGAVLAPSWLILGPALVRMRAAETREQKSLVFAEYERLYLGELEGRLARQSRQWAALLENVDELTLVCFCADAEFCHRRLAAAKLAAESEGMATYCGERPPPPVDLRQKQRDLWEP